MVFGVGTPFGGVEERAFQVDAEDGGPVGAIVDGGNEVGEGGEGLVNLSEVAGDQGGEEAVNALVPEVGGDFVEAIGMVGVVAIDVGKGEAEATVDLEVNASRGNPVSLNINSRFGR